MQPRGARGPNEPGRAVAVVAILVLAMALVGCGDDDGPVASPPSDPPATTSTITVDRESRVRPLLLLRDFLECFVAEAPDADLLSGGPLRRLQSLRELDLADSDVRSAVRACFPTLAQAFTDAGLRPPTQGDLGPANPPGPSAPGAPVVEGDFADPFLLTVGDDSFVYATNTLGQNVPAARFDESRAVSERVEALPDLPGWSEPGTVWAPSVARVDDGFALYYTTRHVASGLQCISVAAADEPLGPFVDESERPLICQTELGGSIDPSPYDDGQRSWLVWKSDGNCCGIPTTIFVQETSPDGTTVFGEPEALLTVDQAWEGDLIEGPSLIDTADELLLFYSANRWDTADYAVGFSVCESVTGPCTKPQDTPWLFTYEHAAGPGGEEISVGPDGPRVVYHGWSPDAVGYENGGVRRLYAEPIDLQARPPGLDFSL